MKASFDLYGTGSNAKVHQPGCGTRSRRARAIRGTKGMTAQALVEKYGDRLCKTCCANLIEAAAVEAEVQEAEVQAEESTVEDKQEVSATTKTLEFLATSEGKKAYKKTLDNLRAGEDRFEPIWDRFPGYALEVIHVQCGGGYLDQDQVLDQFTQSTNTQSPDGDPLYTSTLPRLISLTKGISKMKTSLGHILDNDKDPNWGN